MKIHPIELDIEALYSHLKPQIRSLSYQSDGTLLCGIFLGKPSLLKISVTNKGTQATDIENLKLEELLENDSVLGVYNGLRTSLKGDTAFSVLHTGGGPGFLKKMLNKDIAKLEEGAFFDFLVKNSSSGMAVKHSIVQIRGGRFDVRFFKQPGALLDAAHIGDFLFGLAPDAVFREPYLNSEKRYMLRTDLEPNGMIHKQDSGYFWFLGKNNKVMRLGQTDNKAIPTTKTLPGAPFSLSVSSETDGCLYGICNEHRTLFRLRNNPVTKEDELELIKTFDLGTEITALYSIDQEKSSKLLVALKTKNGVQLLSLSLKPFADDEIMEKLPDLEETSDLLTDYEEISQFSGDVPEKGNFRVWAAARQKTGKLLLLKLDF